MSVRRKVARNVVWNWAGMAAQVVSGFVVAPLLVHRLGETTYGLWILISSLTGYFALLDLGVRGSVGRYIAYYQARGDRDEVNATLSTALAALTVLGMVAMAGVLVVAAGSLDLFKVPPGQENAARLALVIVAVNLALSLPLNAFDATLWAFQRFDALNWIDIPVAFLRIGFTWWLVDAETGLVTLAVVTLATTFAAGAAKAGFSFGVERGLRVGPGFLRRRVLRDFAGYGSWNFLLSIGQLTTGMASSFLVGSTLGLAALTPYSLARRLVQYSGMTLGAATGVLTPLAAGLHAREDGDRKTRMFVEGGKVCLAFSLFVLTGYLLMGRDLLALWVGSSMAYAAQYLAIMVMGETLPMSQHVTGSLLLGMAKNRVPALLGVLENAWGLGLALFLWRPYGLTGVCLSLAIAAAVFRGVAPLAYACHVLDYPLGRYLRRVVLPPLAAAGPPALLLASLTAWSRPASWAQIVLYSVFYTVIFAAMCRLVLLRRGAKLPTVVTAARSS